jgi:hypothetical protein
VFYGQNTGSGLSLFGSDVIHQNLATPSDAIQVQGVAERFDYLGSSLAVGDIDNDGVDDLAIGVPGEAIGSVANAGAVNVVYGTFSSGIRVSDNQIFHQDAPGIREAAENGDRFGTSVEKERDQTSFVVDSLI